MSATEPASELNSPAAPPRKGTILVVDDEEGPRQSLRVIFKDEYNLLFASNGRDAVDIAQKQKIDVAVLDIRMGGMSGIEVLERLKFIEPKIEVVMMTAFETADTMRQALRLRACDYINKPFDISIMRAAVAGAMQRRVIGGEIQENADHVAQLLTDLQNQKMEEQIVRTRGDIYASIIHDINGPLAVISGFVQMMNQRVSDTTRLDMEDLEYVREQLKTITRQVTICVEISRRYLGFLRRQSDASHLVGVNHLLNDVGELIRVHPSVQQHEFSCRELPQDATVPINGTDLIQILLNLAVNAFQCDPKSHRVEISAELLDQPLAPDQTRGGSNDRWLNMETFANHAPLVAISVRDTGPGIPTEILPKIFDAYFTTKSAKQGTGLGLSIVLRLIKAASGLLHVHTQPGQGTTFTVYLPAQKHG